MALNAKARLMVEEKKSNETTRKVKGTFSEREERDETCTRARTQPRRLVRPRQTTATTKRTTLINEVGVESDIAVWAGVKSNYLARKTCLNVWRSGQLLLPKKPDAADGEPTATTVHQAQNQRERERLATEHWIKKATTTKSCRIVFFLDRWKSCCFFALLRVMCVLGGERSTGSTESYRIGRTECNYHSAVRTVYSSRS